MSTVTPTQVLGHFKLLHAFDRMFATIPDVSRFEAPARARFLHTIILYDRGLLSAGAAIPLDVIYMWYYHKITPGGEKAARIAEAPLPPWMVQSVIGYITSNFEYQPPNEARAKFVEDTQLPFTLELNVLEFWCFNCAQMLGRWQVAQFHCNIVVSTTCMCRSGISSIQDEILRRWIARVVLLGDFEGSPSDESTSVLQFYMKYAVSHRPILKDLLESDLPAQEVVRKHFNRRNRPFKSYGYSMQLYGRETDMALAAAPPVSGKIPLTSKYSVYNLSDQEDSSFRQWITIIADNVNWGHHPSRDEASVEMAMKSITRGRKSYLGAAEMVVIYAMAVELGEYVNQYPAPDLEESETTILLEDPNQTLVNDTVGLVDPMVEDDTEINDSDDESSCGPELLREPFFVGVHQLPEYDYDRLVEMVKEMRRDKRKRMEVNQPESPQSESPQSESPQSESPQPSIEESEENNVADENDDPAIESNNDDCQC